MGTQNRIETLKSRHRHLEHLLREEMKRPWPDSIRLSELKKRKLAAKTGIAVVRRGKRAMDRSGPQQSHVRISS